MPVPSASSEPRNAFTGFSSAAFTFLRELAAEQNREWFLRNKARYEADVRAPMAALVASLGFALAARDIPLIGEPKAAIFRVNRDVRFSKDKRPYKETISAVLTRDGTKRAQGLLYIQVGAGASFAAAGSYGVEPDQLAAIRARMAERPERWLEVESRLAKKGLALSRDSIAVRQPAGLFIPDALKDTIRLKTFITSMPLSSEQLAHAALVERIARFAEDALPLLEFGWSALAERPPRRA